MALEQVDEAADEALSENEAAGIAGVDRRMLAQKTKTQRNKEERRRLVSMPCMNRLHWTALAATAMPLSSRHVPDCNIDCISATMTAAMIS